MELRDLDCLAPPGSPARPLHAVRPAELGGFLDRLAPAQARFLEQGGFTAAAQELRLIPGPDGVAAAVIGLGEDRSPYAFGDLAARLPAASDWELVPGDYDPAAGVLGFCLGAYRFPLFTPAKRRPARLSGSAGQARALTIAGAAWMVRDLINAPANHLGPRDLAGAALALAERHGAAARLVEGAALDEAYPAIAAVGAGSARPPCVAVLHWSGPGAGPEAPLLSLCGKGVCFDSGGYDIKPSAGMLRMKKDMGGAATLLGLARIVMEAGLPVRLALRVGCVENSVSGTAMRPLDVLRTRAGLTVEVGNTDAEGRLVLCDLLAEACEEKPDLLVDCATLTGAARVAVGPDLPALFCNDEAWAAALLAHGTHTYDPLWRLPLWEGYDEWLASPIADVNNIASKPHAGAVIAALFLRRFVAAGTPWAHIDLYAWNEQSRPGRPEGGEAQAMRALFDAVAEHWSVSAGPSHREIGTAG
ncbi:MAG: leucyl aminopeptidase family protein [Acidisphaera sp.]|nr:leucyl aminopeptidase family protein [Acidisphaera sp.]